MSNEFFRFKQFRIRHDRCAMKVGTDGVLLGAWGSVEGRRILDIGTGTGLIALMAAQRNAEADILGIDIDEAAVQQARENVSESPFHERISIKQQDILAFRPSKDAAGLFDAILCNPPFFTEDTLPPNAPRALARNSQSLPFPCLVKAASLLLTDEGKFSVIIPYDSIGEFVGLCLAEGLHLMRRCIVRTKAGKPPRRAMLAFSPKKQGIECETEELCLTNDDGSRSMAYNSLTDAFYL